MDQGKQVYILGSSNSDNSSSIHRSEGEITEFNDQNNYYQYTNFTSPNMRGGGILDSDNHLIGIHLSAGSGIAINEFLEAAPTEVLQILNTDG